MDVSKILQVFRDDELKQLKRKDVDNARACAAEGRLGIGKAACRPMHQHLPSYGRLEWDRVFIPIQAGHFGADVAWPLASALSVPVRHFLQNSSAPPADR